MYRVQLSRRRNNQLDGQKMLEQPETGVSLEEASRMFLREHRHLAAHTQRFHRENLTSLARILALQGKVILDCRELTASLLKHHYLYYMMDDLHLKPNTINGRIRTVRQLIAFLHQEGYLLRDYGVDVPMVKGDKVIIQAFSEEQVKRLLEQPDKQTFTGLRDYTLMMLLLETGVRISECIGIALRDVHLKEGNIVVCGKGSKHRTVPIQSKMIKVLRTYLAERGAVMSDALFVTIDGTAIQKRSVQEIIGRYGETARIDDVRVSPHTFRHTFAKFYILAGGDIFSLQKILGHSTLDTVRIYVEMFTSDVQQQHSKFSFVEHRLR
ncbi:tyrosine-type recombinase/integrase [Alicyclobacillus mengziensis]|uniref:Tyrosine-type recombinase/integrase n=1 Tax=Alicyclobacillus mengziensis TaxID=2931921 RepID=A0A9X7Z5A3_9BACL|nr:tyrosine-type recombinase/integrase [Alicyclobacillus mengziensis]QSO46759.1 tyrosine-type recombinase/integrase [Alicyclobacillus mengziensis]